MHKRRNFINRCNFFAEVIRKTDKFYYKKKHVAVQGAVIQTYPKCNPRRDDFSAGGYIPTAGGAPPKNSFQDTCICDAL